MDTETDRASRTALFGPFSLDLDLGELRRDGEVVPVRPKPLQVLVRLLEGAGSLTPREELLEDVWGDVHLASDTVLHTAIGEIRQALEDDAAHPRFVETVHRRGYRFIAPVRWADDDSTQGTAGRAGTRSATARWAVIAAVIVAVTMVGLLIANRDGSPTREPEGPAQAPESLLRARYLVNHGSPEDIETGVELLRTAVARDDAGALAWSGLAVGELRLNNFDAARDAASRALELDPESGEACRVLGQVMMVRGRNDEAERLLLTALELDPSTGKAHYAYSVLLALTGRMGEAVRIAETAAALAPRTMNVQVNLARLRFYNRDLAGAIEAARRAIALDEGPIIPAADTLQAALWLGGDIAGARDAALLVARQMGASGEELARFAAASPAAGLRGALLWQVERIRSEPTAAPETHIDIACLCVQLGDVECATDELAQLPPAESLEVPTRLQDPRLESLPLPSRDDATATETQGRRTARGA